MMEMENDNSSDFNLADWFEEAGINDGLKLCNKQLECGHNCLGAKHKDACLPCMEPNCSAAKIDKNELCAICYTS